MEVLEVSFFLQELFLCCLFWRVVFFKSVVQYQITGYYKLKWLGLLQVFSIVKELLRSMWSAGSSSKDECEGEVLAGLAAAGVPSSLGTSALVMLVGSNLHIIVCLLHQSVLAQVLQLICCISFQSNTSRVQLVSQVFHSVLMAQVHLSKTVEKSLEIIYFCQMRHTYVQQYIQDHIGSMP